MRMMAVHAHPDDEASKGAGTMARYVTEGHRVRVVTCTGGERGDILNPRLEHDKQIIDNLLEVRRAEMAAAAEALGIEHAWLGFVDSGLPEGDPMPPLPEGCFALVPDEEATVALVKQIREFRPHIMTTYNEIGGYPHPDHIATHRVSMAALAAAADPEFHPELGEPWQIQKVYYDVSFGQERLEAIHEAMVERGLESPFLEWLRSRGERPQREATARIKVDEFFPQRDAALRAHATQIDPDGFFFQVPHDLEAEVWPWEEFELAYSAFPVTGMEDDLFAGID
ncbi:mycothiol conjugate amidase Mca [Bowdeniella nasicola]|uniref:Mycothiol S-conjugate amidase n=2 Tax=Bowdeniella nasicola TaxID=208480 RepID=A0A1Q5Q2G0_9ACTO|nr:mycothiol conjugate amidase Mca [Bowdeniella nasicola]